MVYSKLSEEPQTMEPRRRGKKAQVAPGEGEDMRENKGKDNANFVLNELGDETANNLRGSLRFSEAAKKVSDEMDAFKLLANVRSSASKWKSYATSRRFKKRTLHGDAEKYEHFDRMVQETGQDGESVMQRQSAGIGLDDIHDDYIDYKTFRQSRGPVMKKDFEMSIASNRALMQYFAKLGQSMKEDETINLEFVHTLVSSGADINCTDKYGQTVLHEVARAWHVDVASFLLEHGADVDKKDNYGRTALHVAAAVDYPEMVNLLIEGGADKEARTTEEYQTPVFYAAKNDACQSLKALIKQGCLYMKEKDYKGRTPIHVAAELDRSETARILLELNAPVWIPDNEGIRAITWMINKMPPVANEALNQFHLTDRPNRKQYFYLNFLVRDKEKDPDGKAQTPLHVVVGFRQYDLIMHSVFIRLSQVMWQRFGRFWALFNLGLNFLYILMWTVIGMVVEYDQRHIYTMPEDVWRIVLFLVAVLFTFYQIFEEVMDFIRSQRVHSEFEKKRVAEIERDLKFCHPRWPGEEKYLREEIEAIEDLKPKYFSDMWNIFDWLCYILLTVCIVTHIADVIAHSETLARLHIRIMSITIILLWLRLMKNARAFALLGPFIVMLGHMLKDCARFLFLYMEFYIPYLAAFWMIFGGTKKARDNSGEEVSVDGYQFFGQLFFSMLRLTLVDEYDYDNMKKIDHIMADILLATWFLLSAILCLNLFIALLSDTFQRVYDNAQANAVMQKAITIINIWEGINRKRKNRFWEYIESTCSPLIETYDDDMTQTGDEDLKKVTIQIKEDLDHFQEMFKLHFGDPTSQLLGSNLAAAPSRSGGGGGGKGGTLVSARQFEAEVEDLRESLKTVKSQQEEMALRLKKDMSSVKSMLKLLLGKEPTGGAYEIEETSLIPSEMTPVAKMRRKKKKSQAAREVQKTSTELQSQQFSPLLDIGSTEFTPATFIDPSMPVSLPAVDVTSTSSSQHPSRY
ncbi:uncharacterized protein LOC101851051 isoform X3 [Aplysia californica]|uniref:Uncharacterized protein LOC101851051 isoform X3 n=1 Tax=Aplysia californica TaxID=6500 RepID=A0ABM1VVP3_APLCA|nr:uncharacterized protein LOC101851051 isoform X3 [Aplysia californica]